MARPIKEGLDYFPHDVDLSSDEKIEAIEALYGLEGYAIYLKLLERIYRNGGKFKIATEETAIILAKKMHIKPVDNPVDKSVNNPHEVLLKIINSMVEYNLFNSRYWKRHKTLISSGILKRLKMVVNKRVMSKNRYQKNVSVAETTQKPHKVKESKGKERKAVPPEVSVAEIKDLKKLEMNDQQIKEHFTNRGFTESEIDKAMGKEF